MKTFLSWFRSTFHALQVSEEEEMVTVCGLIKEIHQFNTERLSAESSSWGSFEL